MSYLNSTFRTSSCLLRVTDREILIVYVHIHTWLMARTGCIALWPFFLLNITILFILFSSFFLFFFHCDLTYFPPSTPLLISVVFISPLFLFSIYVTVPSWDVSTRHEMHLTSVQELSTSVLSTGWGKFVWHLVQWH